MEKGARPAANYIVGAEPEAEELSTVMVRALWRCTVAVHACMADPLRLYRSRVRRFKGLRVLALYFRLSNRSFLCSYRPSRRNAASEEATHFITSSISSSIIMYEPD